MTKAGSRIGLLGLLLLLMLGMLARPMSAYAELPYQTFTFDSYKQPVFLPPTYYPVGVIGKAIYIPDPKKNNTLQFSPFVNPQDLFIDSKDEMYIADTGNNRIVQLDSAGKYIRTIQSPGKALLKPEGVYVSDNGTIYVADTGNHRVVVFDPTGKMIKEIKKPESKFIRDTYQFDPAKIIVDNRGFLYIATHGGYEGLMMLDAEGRFQSFVGANATELSFADSLKKLFYPKEMYARELSKLPSSINNVTLGPEGFIHTVSGGDMSSGQIKKFNIRWKNMLDHTDPLAVSDSNVLGGIPGSKPQLADIAVDLEGNMTVIDTVLKYISQYDANGNLLFFWGGSSNDSTSPTLGVVKNPSSIAADSHGSLYVLDNQQNIIQMFQLTEFGKLIHNANQLTEDGRYEESEAMWKQVLKYNSRYDLALAGLAKSEYKKEDYPKAMELFREAGVQRGYSDAFWQIRLKWFQKYFSVTVNILLALIAAWLLFMKIWKKMRPSRKGTHRNGTENRFIMQLKHAFYMIKHPIDGFTAIRHEGKGSYWSAGILLIAVYISLCVSSLYTSFTFDRTLKANMNFMTIFIQFFSIWMMWVISNYLTSSVSRGEGTFKDIFVSSAYCLIPYIVVGVPLTMISNVLTLSESSIFSFIHNAVLIWTGLFFIWKVQTIHNYSVSETAVNVVTTLCTMIVFGVLIFITYGISGDLKDFITLVYKEVTVR